MPRWRERWASSALTTSTALELRTSTLISTCWPETRLLPRPKRSCAASLRRSASLSRVALGSHCSTESEGEPMQTRTRVAFQPGDWDRAHRRNLQKAVPVGFSLRRISAGDVARFSRLADSLVYNFPTLEEFAARGVGFGVEHKGRYVSGCSSFAVSSRSLEFEIQTHPDFLRRGLASACAAAMIEYCLEHGLRPCWDAHNDVSAALATKLGFTNPAPYTAYEAT